MGGIIVKIHVSVFMQKIHRILNALTGQFARSRYLGHGLRAHVFEDSHDIPFWIRQFPAVKRFAGLFEDLVEIHDG